MPSVAPLFRDFGEHPPRNNSPLNRSPEYSKVWYSPAVPKNSVLTADDRGVGNPSRYRIILNHDAGVTNGSRTKAEDHRVLDFEIEIANLGRGDPDPVAGPCRVIKADKKFSKRRKNCWTGPSNRTAERSAAGSGGGEFQPLQHTLPPKPEYTVPASLRDGNLSDPSLPQAQVLVVHRRRES